MSFSPTRTGAQRRAILTILLTLLALAATLQVAPNAGAAGTVVVTSIDGTTWHDADTRAPGTGVFQSGPATPPLGVGSFKLTTTGNLEKVQLFTSAYANTSLSSVDGIGYSTYRDPASTGFVAGVAGLNLRIDLTGDGSADAYMVYEPYQDMGNAAVLTGVWQTWDAYRSGAAKWWINTGDGGCGQATPCTWSAILAAFPNATIREGLNCAPAGVKSPCPGSLGVNQGSFNSGIITSVDALYVSIALDLTTFDFEPTPQCTTTCYADAVNGSDANGGTSAADAKKTIQAAIDQVSAGGQVRVMPGTYSETATNRFVGVNGPHQFGLFFPASKPGVQLIGVDGTDTDIVNAATTLATINTNATNNFGHSGIFVEAANIVIQGVKIGPNAAGDNKTIEVIGDDFTLRHSTTAIPGGGGSVYINDWSGAGDVVQSYHILDNIFPDGTSIDIASGAGNTGSVSAREILNNTFDLVDNGFNGISFSGSGGVPWFVHPVGGALISGNSFASSTQYIRARGVYHEAQFDWVSYWNDNTFDKAAIALVTEAPFAVRPYAYSVFTNVRRIGATIQGEIQDGTVTHAQAGDTVLVKAGTYPELVVIDRTLTVKGAQSGVAVAGRTFAAATEATISGEVKIQAADVTVDGFSITNPGQLNGILVKTAGDNALIQNNIIDTVGGPALSSNAQGIYLEHGPDGVSILNNRINNIQSSPSAKGVYVGDSTASNPSLGVLVEGNVISNIISTLKGAYGVQVNNGVYSTGYTEITILGNNISGMTGFGWAHAIGLEGDTPVAVVTKNIISGVTDQTNTTINDALAVFFESNPSFALADVNRNALLVGTAAHGIAVHPALTGGSVDGTCNWWGDASGPGLVAAGTGSLVSAAVTYNPWLLTADLDGACEVDSEGPISSPSAAPAPINSPITVSAVLSDATTGGNPVVSYTWTVDGSPAAPVAFVPGVTVTVLLPVAASAVPDVVEVCVVATDIYGNVGDESCTLVVWYDPTAGFVTGGGWFMSPAGAYVADETLTGKASFGFVSKYQKGKIVPTGNTEFQFKAGGLNFSSTSYDWLVVAGAKAQFKGTGTINGAGTYRFILTAIDGQVSGGGGSDKFRIRIWDDVDGGLVYDNMLSVPDSEDPTTTLGGGQIVIHK